MDDIILCHVAGLNNITKHDFITHLVKYNNIIEVIDFDMITKIIYKSSKFKEYEKKKQHPQMVRYWENEFSNILKHNLTESKKNNKKVICIGSNVYARSRFIHINVSTTNLFFLNTPIKQYVKQIITHNIQSYPHEIIDGTFPLKFIQHDFLSSQRKILEEIHKRLKYKMCSMDVIIDNIAKIIKINNVNTNDNKKNYKIMANTNTTTEIIDVPTEKNKSLYFTSSTKYTSRIINNINSDIASMFSSTPSSVTAYEQKWMALLCSILEDGTRIDKKFINISTDNNNIIIKELKPNTLNGLHKYVYIYEVSSEGFENNKESPYKYKSVSPVEILNTHYVSDIYDELNNTHGIKLELK